MSGLFNSRFWGSHSGLFKASPLQNESPSQLPRKLRGFTSRSQFITEGSSSGRDWRQKPQRNTAHWLVCGFKTITLPLCVELFIHTHSTIGNPGRQSLGETVSPGEDSISYYPTPNGELQNTLQVTHTLSRVYLCI